MAKTTVELPDELVREAKAFAVKERTTLRELVERGLRLTIRPRTSPQRFRLHDASIEGNGLTPEFEGAGWDAIRDAIYGVEEP